METKIFKYITIIGLTLLFTLTLVKSALWDMFFEPQFHFLMFFITTSAINIALICSWTIMVSIRIMHKNIRNYLLFLGVSAMLWLLVRNIKWAPFQFLDVGGRHLWYCFYFFIIVIPLLGLFLALAINRNEYGVNKSRILLPGFATLLCIPAVILLLLVMTNDLHQFVFKFNKEFKDWNTDYSYGLGYWIIMVFVLLIIFLTALNLIKSWRKSNRNRKTYLTLLVLGIGLLYSVGYIFRVYFILHHVSLTTFSCFLFIAFWESYIQLGIIPSNTNYRTFFEKSELSAQGIDESGKVVIKSYNTEPINKEEFLELKSNGFFVVEDRKIFEMVKIESGYAVWGKDITQLSLMNNELQELNEKLFGEVELLEKEEKLREDQSRIEKLNSIYGLITKEVIPSMDKIGSLVKASENANREDKDKTLKEIKVISCYVKRKTNLLLLIDNEDHISNGDMLNSFNESFKSLNLLGAYCGINYNFSHNISNQMHLIFYDFFQEVIEKTNFVFEEIFINGLEDEENIRFSITVTNEKKIIVEDLLEFKQEELKELKAIIDVENEEEIQNIILLIPKKKEA